MAGTKIYLVPIYLCVLRSTRQAIGIYIRGIIVFVNIFFWVDWWCVKFLGLGVLLFGVVIRYLSVSLWGFDVVYRCCVELLVIAVSLGIFKLKSPSSWEHKQMFFI